MSIVNRGTDRPKELNALPYRQRTSLACQCDGLTFHIFHHEVRTAVLRFAAVQNCSDIGMSQSRENLPLRTKPLNQRRRLQSLPYHLNRDNLKILIVRPDTQIHDAHSAAVYLADQTIRT